jgi:putative SOS response-associated peptidase YedK
MCGRYCSDLTPADVAKMYDLVWEGPPHWNFPTSYNVCPTDPVATIVKRDDKRILEVMRWGIIPFFHKKSIKDWKVATFNARMETIEKLSTFRNIWRRNRCLIPVSGYYEWHRPEGAPKKEPPQPYYFTARDGSPILTVAGIWDRWKNPADGKDLHSCAMVITEPNNFVAEVHDRMPVLLQPDQFDACLDGSAGKEVMVPAAEDMLQKWPVSKKVNSSRTPADDPSLIKPVDLRPDTVGA